MAAIANFVGLHAMFHDSIPWNWNTWRYWPFYCYYRQQPLPNHKTLIVFQDKHRTTQAFVGPSQF